MFKKGWLIFSEILDLSSPNTREKYLLKTKCLNFFSLQATAVDRCDQLLIEKTFQRQPFILLVETLQVCRYLVGVYLLKTISDWSPLSAEIQISKKISIDLVTFWAESRLQKVIVYIYSKWFLVQVILKFSRFTCSSVLTVFVTFVYFFNA